jgi:hypothetical protein
MLLAHHQDNKHTDQGIFMRRDGCSGRAGKAELLTGIERVSSRPVRRILLMEG